MAKKRLEHPFSEQQRKWAWAATERGELPAGKAREWSHRVKGKKLPKRSKYSGSGIFGVPDLQRGYKTIK